VHESRAQRHVTEDTSDQGQKDTIQDHRHQLTIKSRSINQSTHCINELIYLNFVTGGNQARLDARTEFEIPPKGGEAGRAQSCRLIIRF